MNVAFRIFLLVPGFFLFVSCVNLESKSANENQYTVIGNVSAIANATSVEVQWRYYDETGMPDIQTLVSAPVGDDGWFEIQGEIDSPTMVKIVTKITDDEDEEQTRDSAIAVIEPGARLVVAHYGPFVGNYVDGTGSHGELVSSWQFEDGYVNARNRYGYQLELRTSVDQQIETAKQSGVEDSDIEAVADPAESEEIQETRDLDLEELNKKRGEILDEAWETYKELDRFRGEALTELSKSDDPYKALLAIELMEHLGTSAETQSRLTELAELLDAETVASRVTPKQERLAMLLERKSNDQTLETGVMAPDFTAPNVAGEDVNLYELIADKEVVLLDFWASWCGPCIQTFPKLRELYAEYHDRGFEIVMVSIDDTDEDWTDASDEHELAWPNLGDIHNDVGPVAMAYGVAAIPKGFVLDKTGKIVARDLNTSKLEEFLAQQLDQSEDS